MTPLAKIQDVRKRYGQTWALDGVSFEVPQGAVLGLIGPNGAGKTTLLKAMLGLLRFEGDIDLLGRSPRRFRHELMRSVGYISDVGILPRWMRVDQLIRYSAAVHPNFSEQVARDILSKTEVSTKSLIKALSKGMMTQVHLALVMAMDVKLLILDEPTLGLDIVYRSRFYEQILQEFLTEDRSLVISTHQVEEIESLLTHLVLIDQGKVRLCEAMDRVYERFTAVDVAASELASARSLSPVSEKNALKGATFIFDGVEETQLQALGTCRRPGVAELFVSIMGRG